MSRSNLKEWLSQHNNKQPRYRIQRLSIGVVSVLTATWMLSSATSTIAAETAITDTGSETEFVEEVEEPADQPIEEAEPVEEQSVEEELIEEEPSVTSPETEDQSQPVTLNESVEETAQPEPVADGDMRVHIDSKIDPTDKGLWVWGGARNPSDNWASGATPIDPTNRDEFGYYVDIPMKDGTESLGAIIVNRNTGDKDTGDLTIDRVDEKQQHVWLQLEDDSDPNNLKFNQQLYEPLQDENLLRVNYYREDGNYDNWGLWVWGEGVQNPTSNWPNDALDFDNRGLWGAYVDLPIVAGSTDINFLLVNKASGEQTNDMKFTDRDKDSQIFLRETEGEVHTNPYFISEKFPGTAEQHNQETIVISVRNIDQYTDDQLTNQFTVTNAAGEPVTVTATVNRSNNQVVLTGNFAYNETPFNINFGELEVGQVTTGWRAMDDQYAYDGQLGAELHEDGTATVTVWSPTADAIQAVIYDKDNQTKVVATVDLNQAESGAWTIDLNEDNTQLSDLTGYFYHYAITRGDETVMALDPYAKSMAAWNSDEPGERIGKAAFVDIDKIGPELDYANIPGYTKREDAIIYEAHVRDFTSDPALDRKLDNQFGTFTAFIERLDYLQDLGVTHIQLLPVMSYIHGNELNNHLREMEYASANQNYNWGYDPQSYFALSGMYSDNPTSPTRRIEEFKLLIDAIHERGMGVILDVVYNHTGADHVLEDLQPGYYNFTDANGNLVDAFGGGALDTRRHMSRRLLIDSIVHWTKNYKVDGFRFDMMGEHDLETIQMAYDEAAKLNPNMFFLGEGWRGYKGPDNVVTADQDAMRETDDIGVFSDEIRNELKSGFGSEGQPRFLTGGKRNVYLLFNNIIGNPSNFIADDPGDVIQYIAAHDNLTLHDVIAQSIKKDPKYHQEEIHQRIRLGNMIILTSQGTPFIHSGQEYGRTKQFRHPDYKGPVDQAPNKSTFMTDEEGNPFEYPYFIHDSYDSSDAVNHFDWDKVTDSAANPISTTTHAYTRGLIHLRRSTDAFSHGTVKEVADNVRMITSESIGDDNSEDLVIAYEAIASNGDRYAVIINADSRERNIKLTGSDLDFLKGQVLADGAVAGTEAIADLTGVNLGENGVTLAPLTATIIKLSAETEPGDDDKPESPDTPDEKPGDDDKPELPGNPDDDVKPELPENPDDDVKPELPENPDDDVKPELPESPDEDVKPELPENPDEDVTPELPENPDDDVKPELPENPDDDVKPELPDTPDEKPGDDDKPELPDTPDEKPGDDDKPELPDTPDEKPGDDDKPSLPDSSDGEVPPTSDQDSPGGETGSSDNNQNQDNQAPSTDQDASGGDQNGQATPSTTPTQQAGMLPATGEDRIGMQLASLTSLLAGLGVLGYSATEKSRRKN